LHGNIIVCIFEVLQRSNNLIIFIMPAFFTHTPTHSSTSRAYINAQKLTDYNKPIGIIGDSLDKAYGFDGDSYYVTLGCFPTLAFGKMFMTFDQAKCAYDAILFFNIDVMKWDFDSAKKALKEARKNKLSGDALMFFFGNLFKDFKCSL